MAFNNNDNNNEKRAFYVRACWDAEAGIFYSQSDIDGLVIEAETVDEFEKILFELAPTLIIENHMTARIASTPLKDLIPAILWQRPDFSFAPAE